MHVHVCAVRWRRGAEGGAGEWARGSWDAQTEKNHPPPKKNHMVQGLSNVQRFLHIYMCQKLTGGAIFLSVSKWIFVSSLLHRVFGGPGLIFFFKVGPPPIQPCPTPSTRGAHTGFVAPLNAMHVHVCAVRWRRGEAGVVRRSGEGGRGTPKQKNETQKITSLGVGGAAHWT